LLLRGRKPAQVRNGTAVPRDDNQLPTLNAFQQAAKLITSGCDSDSHDCLKLPFLASFGKNVKTREILWEPAIVVLQGVA
jgi:hypothetical protein